MSIRLPMYSAGLQDGASQVKVAFPDGAWGKASNTAVVMGGFFSTPPFPFSRWRNNSHVILARNAGATGGGDGYLRLNPAGTELSLRCRRSGVDIIPAISISGLSLDTAHLWMIVGTATQTYFAICPVGGSATITTTGNNGLFSQSFGGSGIDKIWDYVGSNQGFTPAYYGPVENVFFCEGMLASAGLTAAEVEGIADGSTSIETLAAAMTAGVEKCHYSLLDQDDTADAFGLQAAVSFLNEDNDGFVETTGPIVPGPISPNMTRDSVSQAVPTVPGDWTTAIATVKIEGGSFTDSGVVSVRARLLNEAGVEVVPWSVIDAAPGPNTWQAGEITGVPMVLNSGRLRCEIGTFNSLGQPISRTWSHGLKGAGISGMGISQSQGKYWWEVGAGVPLDSGVRLMATYIRTGTDAETYTPSARSSDMMGLARGMRECANLLNSVFPGVPIELSTVGISGRGLHSWEVGGSEHYTFAEMLSEKGGIIQPYVHMMIGHSSGADYATYGGQIANVVAETETAFGAPVARAHAMTARYSASGATSSYTQPQGARDAIRDRCIATGEFLLESFMDIQSTQDESGGTSNDPHPSDGDEGQGRAGVKIARGLLWASGLVSGGPVELKTAESQGGGTIDLSFGFVNGAQVGA